MTGDKINSSKSDQKDNSQNRISSKKSNSKHAFDYEPHNQNKSRSSIKSNSKGNVFSKTIENKKSQRSSMNNSISVLQLHF